MYVITAVRDNYLLLHFIPHRAKNISIRKLVTMLSFKAATEAHLRSMRKKTHNTQPVHTHHLHVILGQSLLLGQHKRKIHCQCVRHSRSSTHCGRIPQKNADQANCWAPTPPHSCSRCKSRGLQIDLPLGVRSVCCSMSGETHRPQ